METLNYNAKIAILRLLQEIMNADHFVHENELEYMNQVMASFKLDDSHREEVDNLEMNEAMDVVKELTSSQKSLTAQMMGKMVIIDKDINYNEVILYNDICHSCNIDEEFNVDDYPDLSLSGPFINPEDILEMV